MGYLLIESATNQSTIIDLAPLLSVQRVFDRAHNEVILARVDSLIKDIRKATSREDLRALWTRQALSRHRAMERRRRARLDPSELSPGEFRRVDRACGSGWRVVLR